MKTLLFSLSLPPHHHHLLVRVHTIRKTEKLYQFVSHNTHTRSSFWLDGSSQKKKQFHSMAVARLWFIAVGFLGTLMCSFYRFCEIEHFFATSSEMSLIVGDCMLEITHICFFWCRCSTLFCCWP
jgi:hypothetical protein